MKNFKFNFFLIAALLVTAATVSAFTFSKSIPDKASDDTVWYFTGTDDQIKNTDFWRNTGTTPEDCVEVGESPCSLSVPAEEEEDLILLFSGMSPEDIVALSDDRRP